MKAMTAKEAIAAIEKHHALLVYPIKNKTEPLSLWSHFFPRKAMVWDWNEDSHTGIARLWHLREELSRSEKVVYAKWYQGRATFFSRKAFPAILRSLNESLDDFSDLPTTSRDLLEQLQLNSPLSTKQLKKESGLQGKDFEPDYTKGLKRLWERLLIVGYGEIDDGAFPSLAMGATSLMYEDLFRKAEALTPEEAREKTEAYLAPHPSFAKFFRRLVNSRSTHHDR